MNNQAKKIFRTISSVLVAVLILGSLSGCQLEDGADVDKSIVDDVMDIIDTIGDSGSETLGEDGSYGTEDMMSVLFDAFFGGSSDDYGMGESSYSGGESSYTGAPVSVEYSDLGSIKEGTGTRTVLIYMVGSNLESENGCATMDIQEMCEAGAGKNVNVVIEAGGAKKWQNSIVNSNKVGRYQVINDGLASVQDLGKISMVEVGTVTDFITWGVKNYPADSYDFIFWNHGGGTLAGFGMDELATGDLSLGEMASAFKKAGVHFDFIGFDACLMGTVETAYAFSPYADYLIAAEEEEPGYGWYYTNWLKALEKNPSLDMDTLGKIIVDDFIAGNRRDSTTLSVVNLSKVGELYRALCSLCASGNSAIKGGSYKALSNARSKSKNFGEGNYDQIDIIDFCSRCGLDGADKVVAAVKDCLVYHNTNIKNANGLAMYFPYQYPGYYKQMSDMLKGVGMNDADYSGFFNSFLSAKNGGVSSKASSLLSVMTGFTEETSEADVSVEEWYDEELVDTISEEPIEVNEDGLLELTEKGDGFVLQLSDEDWEKIVSAYISVYVDDGEGFIDLGYDDIWEIDDDGDLVIDYDYLWVAIDGQIVPFYMEEEDETADGVSYCYGTVPAVLTSARTGEERNIDLLLYWDDEHEDGYIRGYRDRVDSDEPVLAQRNIANLVEGDVITFVCDFYTYDGEYEDEYLIGEEIIVDHEPKVTFDEIGDYSTDVCALLMDVYGNEYCTESITIE